MKETTENFKEYEATKAIMKANRYDVWNLAGDANKSARVCLMYAITGNLLPARQCGVNAIEKLLTEIIDVTSATCKARYRDIFQSYFEA
jgi:hypothetical protein